MEIELTGGIKTTVDDEKHAFLSRYKWFVYQDNNGKCYPITLIAGKQVRMSRLLLGVESSSYPLVDHKDGDTLNNRVSNLRLATYLQNNVNSTKRRGTSSKYKGVYWDGKQKWKAAITIDGKYIHLGKFWREEDAARAYDKKALATWGEFARINFP